MSPNPNATLHRIFEMEMRKQHAVHNILCDSASWYTVLLVHATSHAQPYISLQARHYTYV